MSFQTVVTPPFVRPFYSLSTLTVIAPLIFAVAGCTPPQGNGGTQDMNSTQFIISTVWFFAIGLVGYFFLVTRPMLQKEESQKKFVSSLKKGDEVVTSGGIFAKVVSAAADVVTIEIAPNVRIRVLPEHVSPVPKAPSAKAEEK